MRTRTRTVRGAVVGLAVLGLAACGGTVGAGSGGGNGEEDGLVRDVDDDAPVLQVHSAGGFVMPGYDFAAVPALTVYEDGRAITHGPQIMIFPGPLLPNLLVAELTADDVAVGKPDPACYLLAASRLGVDPASCIVVEDVGAGLRAGRAAGARVVVRGDYAGPEANGLDRIADYTRATIALHATSPRVRGHW